MSSSIRDAVETEAAPVEAVSGRAWKGHQNWLGWGERYGLLVLLIGVSVYFSFDQPDTFATAANWRLIVASQSVTAVIALGLMLPLLAGNFDVSTGSTCLLSSMVLAGMMSRDGASLFWGSLAVLAIGSAIGVVNGLLVTRFGLDGLIATLGSATIIGGMISWYSDNLSIANGVSPWLLHFGTADLFGVPKLALVALVVAVVVAYVILLTPFGRILLAIGSNRGSAQLVGISVQRTILITYVISGFLGGLAGVLLLAQQGSASPGTGGIGFMLPALAAVFLGASAFRPGQFNVAGTIVGLLLVAVIVSGLTLGGVAPWVGDVIQGGALILAVGASAFFRRRRAGT